LRDDDEPMMFMGEPMMDEDKRTEVSAARVNMRVILETKKKCVINEPALET